MRTEASRRGQAMIEMALGMLVFVLIVGALISIGSIIPESMRLQSMVRRMAGYEAQCNTSDIEPGTADWIWGGETTFRGLEECHMPIMKIPEFDAEGVVK